MKSFVEFVEELRSFGMAKDFQAEEYKAERGALAEKIEQSEETLLKTLSAEQLELYCALDEYIGSYADVLEKDTFLQGFLLGKKMARSFE